MKKFRLKNTNPFFLLFGIFLFLEIVFRILTNSLQLNISILYILIYNAFLAFLIKLLCLLFNKKVNKILLFCLVFLITFIYALELCVYKIFGFYFDLSLIATLDQVAAFASDGVKLVLTNILYIIILFLPFITLLIFNKRLKLEKIRGKKIIIEIIKVVIVFVIFILALNLDSNNTDSAKSLYTNINNNELNIKKFGVPHAFFIDLERTIFGFDEKVVEVKPSYDNTQDNDEVIDVVYDYNNLDIDFDSLIESESNSTIKSMHEYFKNETGTLQNEYTGFFEGKNLILFMAESFNEIAVRKDVTPTLYKLVHSGFVFENFYTPTISSTIGGEFQELTGLVAASGFVSTWKEGNNSYPLGIANVFKNAGYTTYAYHDHNYTFQSRYKYLSALGFTNFTGCKNGLETKINCQIWPESDLEMINATVDDYINSDEPFFVYYATVSGHGGYSFASNQMARKNKSLVADLDYSEGPLSYLAANIELDKALETLLAKLEDAGILDDTVIALVGDHYPYFLSVDEVNEISSYKKDATVEVNHSNFIFYNSAMDTVTVEKVGSQIDVLPTIYNAFALSYDSRVIIGKDILSTEPGLAIFADSSWVSDAGTYFASKNKFVAKGGVEVSDDYVTYMKAKVANKITMSRNIIKNDYYRKIFR